MFRVVLAGFFRVMCRVQTVAVSEVRMVSGLFVVACLIVAGRLAVMLRRVFMMLSCSVVVFCAYVIFGHALLLLVVGMEEAP